MTPSDRSCYPVSDPSIVDSYALELMEKDRTEGPKAKAFNTPFRYSGAMGCARNLAYWAAGYPITNPTDATSLAVMDLGTVLHERLQEAILRRYPDAQLELPSVIEGLISGHCDALIEIEVPDA